MFSYALPIQNCGSVQVERKKNIFFLISQGKNASKKFLTTWQTLLESSAQISEQISNHFLFESQRKFNWIEKKIIEKKINV